MNFLLLFIPSTIQFSYNAHGSIFFFFFFVIYKSMTKEINLTGSLTHRHLKFSLPTQSYMGNDWINNFFGYFWSLDLYIFLMKSASLVHESK